MHATSFQTLLGRLASLTNQQRGRLCVQLSSLLAGDWACDLIDRARTPGICCPHCASTALYRHGKVDHLQRYRCRACKRTFNALTGTPLARLRHRARWRDFLDCMLDPDATVRGSARRSGIHKNTSFRWRHRFLTWAKLDRPRTLQGITEVDERLLPESQKGARRLTRAARKHSGDGGRCATADEQVCIVMARDRADRTIAFVAGSGPLHKRALMANLLPVLERDVLLVTDSNGVYRAFASASGIAHEWVWRRPHIPVEGALHIENVSCYRRRFDSWLRHFRGVATRYLDNYLGWRWALDGGRIHTPAMFLQIAVGVFHT